MNYPGCRRAGLVVAATVLALSGCGVGDPVDAGPDVPNDTAASPTADREQLHALFGAGQFRYMTVDEPEHLAALDTTELALVGEVMGYSEGPDRFPEDQTDRTVLMEVKPSYVFDGKSQEAVRVMLTTAFETKLSDVEAALPTGSTAALYLNEVMDLRSEFDEPVWVPVSPQGFLVGLRSEAAFPMDPQLDDSQGLQEQVPAGVPVP
ncbi:hypothetical protein FXB39_03025 [Nocardioides sp. BGMRC 2183]|nr:hypothetical protein FXB39_03025 [Nocardioides sp. BGMRC 2183]